LDWLNLGNFIFDPYVSLLGAYAIGNSSFNATWLWHRTNVFNATPGVAVAGTVALAGLNPATYSATWWDTFGGAAISNFDLTVADPNVPVILPTPPILRSLALYVGQPARGQISAPTLTRTVVTNSPAFSLPLVLTNSGGLPLSYSLSVTGANPVVYAAINSMQPGGPVFAWKDISSVGSDLGFTALVAGKSAQDEGISGPVNLGFAFPFFNGTNTPGSFTQLYVSPNGFVSFSPFAGDTSLNRSFPNAAAPSNCVAVFWRDLVLATGSHVYASADALNGTFTVQYQDVQLKGGSSTVTCQLILKTTGEIIMQYLSMGSSNTCSVGLQDAGRDQGLTVVYNQNYLQTNFAVRLSPVSWLNFSSGAGTAAGGGAEEIDLLFNPAALGIGTSQATLLVNTSDPALPVTALPIWFTVLPGLPAAPRLQPLPSPMGSWVFQLQGQSGVSYVLQTSPDLFTWTPVATNTLSGATAVFTNAITPGAPDQFWRAIWRQ
jgi:hypothetical protein